MKFTDIADRRIQSQHILQADFTTAHDVVSWMGAMQAQDYPGALWSIGLRSQGLTQKDIEAAITNREIVRTWPMRGTLHFVAAEDIRWMLTLMTPQVISATAARRRQLELDDATIANARSIIETALSGGKCLTRDDLCELLDSKGISPKGQRGIHILLHLSEQGILCFGPHQGKKPTFVLLDEWIPKSRTISRDESLHELAVRYFISHGPASLKDFAGWGKLPLKDARLGIELAHQDITKTAIGGIDYWHSPSLEAFDRHSAFLLPGFDEYMLGYKDRTPSLIAEHSSKIVPGGNGMFLSTIVIDGQVVGTWKKNIRKNAITLELLPFTPITDDRIKRLEQAATHFGRFMELPVTISSIHRHHSI